VPLTLYNTMTRQKAPFVPLDPARGVRLYVCGPTVYDRIHIGNARPLVVFDVLYRLLRHEFAPQGIKVTYARNITDVEDKINARAKERGISIQALTEETTRLFLADAAALGCLEPDVQPRATDHIEDMIRLIETLIRKGHAYAAEGHVLFHVPSMPDYGRLSGRNRDDMIAGARVEVAPYKKDPADFVLWKPSTPDLPGWESPWGRGRPGWHIECSAMSERHLGEHFDIHGGGIDLVFPHHENEIAQSLCAHDQPRFAEVWMHNGFLMTEGQKMSKSLGNFYTVGELLDEFPGEAIRLLLLKTHYRQPQDFTKDGLKEAKEQLDGFYKLLDATKLQPGVLPGETAAASDLVEHLRDDLNTPAFLTALYALRSEIREQYLHGNVEAYRRGHQALRAAGSLVGLLQASPDEWFRWQPKDGAVDEGKIQALMDARIAARKAKNFAEADRIRKELADQGIVLEDGPKGTTWRRA
jgi:cysteinyl-tRNA synthetase